MKHFRDGVRRDTGLELTSVEVDDILGMLRQRGVLPIPRALIESTRQRLGGTDKIGMAQIVAAFRGNRHVLKGDGMHKSRRTSKSTGGAKGSSHEPTLGSSRLRGWQLHRRSTVCDIGLFEGDPIRAGP